MAATKPNLAELVERMPATDKELEALKPPPPTQGDATQPKPRPRPEKPGGSKFTAPDPDVAAKICDEILAGGRDSLAELIGLIRDPASDDFKNYKAEYLLHCLTIHVGRPEKEPLRRQFIDTLAEQLGRRELPVHARGFLLRELQLIGDKAAARAVGTFLTDEQLCDDAARTLLAINDGAVEQFRNALPGATGRRRLVIVQSLAVLKDAGSADALKQAVTDANREIRLAAVWGLARIGDAAFTDLLLKAADTKETWERNKATQACFLLAENLAASGKKTEAAKIYTQLRNTRTEASEQYIRDAATKALAAFGGKLALKD
ncbi:MAG: HEAT repeat domain-containing protein [Verrucomicrobia bacterium]|nr:HEAT repeat domain-containing protein [Verrucomicrobiota bacterium]